MQRDVAEERESEYKGERENGMEREGDEVVACCAGNKKFIYLLLCAGVCVCECVSVCVCECVCLCVCV